MAAADGSLADFSGRDRAAQRWSAGPTCGSRDTRTRSGGSARRGPSRGSVTPVIIVGALFGACKVVQISRVPCLVALRARVGRDLATDLGRDGARGGRDVMVVVGQALNFGVFYRLGAIGVFFGDRLGHEVPWCRAFPFSWIAHPQYAGTVLTIWGLFLVGTVSASGLVRAPRGGDRFLRGERASRKPSGGHGRRGSRHSAARPGVAGPTAGSQRVDPGARRDPAAWRVSACRRGPAQP